MRLCAESRLEPAERVKLAFYRSPYPAIWTLMARSDDENLVITGEVPTFYLKQLAQSIAKRVDGVRRVDNRVTVRPDRRESDSVGLRSPAVSAKGGAYHPRF